MPAEDHSRLREVATLAAAAVGGVRWRVRCESGVQWESDDGDEFMTAIWQAVRRAGQSLVLCGLTGCLAMQPGQRSTFRLVEPIDPQAGLSADAPLGAQPGRALRPQPGSGGGVGDSTRTLDKRAFPTPVDPDDLSIERQPTARDKAGRGQPPRGPGLTPPSQDEAGEPASEPGSGGPGSEGDRLLESPEEAFRGYRPETRAVPEEGLSAPAIDLEEVVPQGQLDLEVRGPRQAPRGKLATFEITLRNSTDHPVRQVGVRCQLPEGVSFPGTEASEVTAQTPLLEPGETRQWTLSLRMNRVGSHCCEFRLLPPEKHAGMGRGESGEPKVGVRRQVCVEVVERQFSIDVLGPARRTEGGRAEFVVVVGNPSAAPRERVQVRLTHDRALELRETTENALRTPTGLEWELGTLAAGETRQVQVEFDCRTIAGRAGVQVEVEASGQAAERAEATVEIGPQTGPLDLQLWDQTEPVRIGKRGVYLWKLRNLALEPARQVRIALKLPPEVVVLAARLKRGETDLEAQYSVREGELTFDVLPELGAEESVEGVVEVEGLSPGRVEVRLSASSTGLTKPVETSEQTLVEAE